MKSLITKILKITAAVFAVNFLVVLAFLLYAMFAGYTSEENRTAFAKVLAGWKVVTPEDYEFLSTKIKGQAALRDEIKTLIAARDAIREREQRTDIINRDLEHRLDRTRQDILASMEDLKRRREELIAAQKEYDEQKKRELDFETSEPFKKQVQMYEGMEPASAAKNIYELSDDLAAKYLSQMRTRQGTRVANEITVLEDQRIAGGTLADKARRLPKILLLVKEYRSAQPAE
jgi:flagellar motility protein MotE (MotC chaperone)